MTSQMLERVAVTGIGLVTPFAAEREASWRAICRGESACRWVELPVDEADVSRSTYRAAGAPMPPFAAASPEPIVAMALHAAAEAWRNAGLASPDVDPHRTGCVIGTSKGGLRSFARAAAHFDERSYANAWPLFLPESPALAVAQEFDVRGSVLCPVAACATGLASLNRGVDLICEGTCDVVLAGSTDASLMPAIVSSFQRLGVLAKGFDDPARACRPFDCARNGFLVGEGAAVLVLEPSDRARARGATIIAEWLAGGSLADAAGITHLDQTGESLARLIVDVLERAGVGPQEIDYVNLHGTGTRENDAVETRGLRRALGAAADRLAGSSLKGALGHLLGAAGSVEMACTILALRDGIVPPTLNLDDPGPECDLNYTPHRAERRPLRYALKLSLGFGGHLSAAVVRTPAV